jgi:hypothetical protein
MNRIRFVVNTLAVAGLTFLAVSTAQAQAPRTWVSGVGDDVNPCSRTAPCKTFAGAISKTATGGEINILDPAGFGALTITKAITVDGLGITGGLLAARTNGFTINITTNLASDKVILRNLEINGVSIVGGFHGIRFLDGAELTVENVNIFNFTGNGVQIGQGQTSITNIRNLKLDNIAGVGINATTSSGTAFVVIKESSIRAANEGVFAAGNASVTVQDTVITRVGSGLRTSGSNSIIYADDCTITFSTTGVLASAGATINLSDSIIAQNVTGLNLNGGIINSFQGNSLINNPTPGAFSNATLKQ